MRRVLVVALLTACGGDGIPITELEPAVISAFCDIYVECGLVDDHATCRSIYTDLDLDDDLIAAVKAGKVIYHEDKARECLDSLAVNCDRIGFDRSEGNSQACEQTFEGTVHAGGACALDEECISQQCEIPACNEACCQGTCFGDAPLARPTLGQACSLDGPDCVDSFCDLATGLCAAYRANGEACTSTSQCADGACSNLVCTALPGPGEPCSSTSFTLPCDQLGYTCSATTMTCVAYGLAGDPCTSARDCSPLYQCNTSGTCELRPTLGDPCGTQTSTGDCIDRSYCEPTTNLCTAPKPDGSTCTSDRECTSDNCDPTSNTCVTPAVCI